jgi:hypothetical protein
LASVSDIPALWTLTQAQPGGHLNPGQTALNMKTMESKLTESKLADTMNGADYVVIDGVMFQTGYLRVPDEFTAADDVVLEARRGETEIDLTREEIDDAVLLGEGVFRLKNGSLVRFLTSAVIH